MPRAIKCPKDIMRKMTTCPTSHFVQGDKLSLRRHHLCLSLQNAYKFGQKLANFGQFSISDPSLFFLLIKKPIILLKFCWKIQMADFRPEKARQASEQIFTLGIKSLGKMSSLGIKSLGNILSWALCLWVF